MKKHNTIVTKKYRVDQYNKVWDEEGFFYCKWNQLTEYEKEIVKENELSFY